MNFPTVITHKEIKVLYQLTIVGAMQRLTVIKKRLGKKKEHKLSVIAFCQAEDLSLDEFRELWKIANNTKQLVLNI